MTDQHLNSITTGKPTNESKTVTVDSDTIGDFGKSLGDAVKKMADHFEKQAYEANVNHPAHYTDGKIEVIDFIEDKGLNFNRGNAVKYIARAGKKNSDKEIEDLQKAVWYLNREIERLEKEVK